MVDAIKVMKTPAGRTKEITVILPWHRVRDIQPFPKGADREGCDIEIIRSCDPEGELDLSTYYCYLSLDTVAALLTHNHSIIDLT